MVSKEISEINGLPPVYFPNEINIASELFTPVAAASHSFECLSGYFSSKVFAELAEPLSILFNDPDAKGRFLISPNLDDSDKTALYEAYKSENSMFRYLFDTNCITPDSLATSTLDVIKYLISTKRLDIKIVLMKKGMMHAKIWIFNTTFGKVAIHGSSNATSSGLMRNFEQLVLSRSWESKHSKDIVDAFKARFDSFWLGERDDSYSFSLNDKTVLDIFSSTDTPMNSDNHSELLEKLKSHMENQKSIQKLETPTWLDYKNGDYAHQGAAIQLWLTNKKGTLEIATGGGKTLTSLVCASIALREANSAILVIAVPSKPLIKQWGLDVTNFGINPIDTEGVSSKDIRKILKGIFRRQKYIPGHNVVIMTHDALKNPDIISVFGKYSGKLMLIGDEAHNLGAGSFVNNPPTCFQYRLALSATPQRQYDDVGTEKLFDFFGEVIFRFSLKEAIGKCLVPFDYYVHKVYLTSEEQDDWNELTDKINTLLWNQDDSETKKQIDLLRIRRKAIAEGAKNKISSFKNLLADKKTQNYSLAFCSSKGPTQLDDVNTVLRDLNYSYHQVTSEETKNKKLMKSLVDSYSSGNIDILTSKKVLDEGFNIPPIKLAYFLASSAVHRTWVQRLGRVLRQSKNTGKVYAVIHDFVVLPTEVNTSTKTLIKNELERMQWFTEHSRNGIEQRGSIPVINEYLDILENL
ncbi:DEAD/DEAH box helicase family protein [Photobacterium sanguinicancri]|uniref:DEAD/DEAH box helicase family protein n=1 Tax=Photobacterium sanguinicancri TaxID=875932 RepID=UPI0024804F4F|nr:DEAD/DEAH box helicase family protein [Photobacterium sanguinicancri]